MRPNTLSILPLVLLLLYVNGNDAWFGSPPKCSVGDVGRDTYSEELAKRLFLYCGVAYLSRDAVRTWTCNTCKTTLKDFGHVGDVYSESHHSQADIGYDSDPNLLSVIVAFRGTDVSDSNYANWVSVNAKIRKVRASSISSSAGSVHRGFYYAYLAMRDGLKQKIRLAMSLYGARKVIFTGHSLGGALATLAATDPVLRRVTGSDVKIYTFGSPRVGDACFASFFTKTVGPSRSYRVFHSYDPVTSIPPSFLGYKHVAKGVNDKTVSLSHSTYVGVTLKYVTRRRRREVIVIDHDAETVVNKEETP